MAECLGYWSEVRGGAGDPRFAAFVAAETCDALGSAWPAASAGRVEPCVAACYGSVAVRACGGVGMRRQAFDCADVGTSCVDNAPPIGPSCGPYAAADCNTCDGDGRAVRCDGASGVKTRSDCAALGRSCQVVAGLPKCVAGATTCGACEAGVLTVCSDEDFGSVDVDCARLGLECVDGNASCGVVSGLTTQCQGATSACDGDLLTYCAAGASRFIDCGDAGGTCQPLTPGGTTEGACVPAPR
ncbi:MAG: hypothetical protein U1F43_20440 [Myxococcota bacterium]